MDAIREEKATRRAGSCDECQRDGQATEATYERTEGRRLDSTSNSTKAPKIGAGALRRWKRAIQWAQDNPSAYDGMARLFVSCVAAGKRVTVHSLCAQVSDHDYSDRHGMRSTINHDHGAVLMRLLVLEHRELFADQETARRLCEMRTHAYDQLMRERGGSWLVDDPSDGDHGER